MRIKYKGPNQFFYRRFWRVVSIVRRMDGTVASAANKRGKVIYLPSDLVVIVVP